MLLSTLIKDFVNAVKANDKVELYNQAGLRHELASFLERKLPADDYGVQIEREAQAVVMAADEAVFGAALLDIYIFERTGKGQFCLQVLAPSQENQSSWAEISKQLKFLEQLSFHGFQEGGLFFACQQHSFNSKAESELKNAVPGYAVEWKDVVTSLTR